ncbi:hypothetical protein [Aureibaculum luteum]|nr:hypothetical protein [Aureibaculum luteum]
MASLTPGFSGTDIANICNEAALIAERKKRNLSDKMILTKLVIVLLAV